ncbi:MAG: phage tail sheath subtilisin-like domain-containing protein [Bacteroidia bacterium]
MPVQPSYPGVYVQEVPSSVRTIVGVSTSIAAFIGRASQGPVNFPQLCLSYSDFDRTFSSDTSLSDMPRAVKLFFLNGGTRCYVTRIVKAGTDQKAAVTLLNAALLPVLDVKAISSGQIGNTIRMSVSYNTQYPESTFNFMVFNYTKSKSGQLAMSNVEAYTNLSMNPADPKYAVTIINSNSNLVNLVDKNIPIPPASLLSYTQAGRPIKPADLFKLINTDKKNSFQLSLDGGSPVNINLAGVASATLLADIQTKISNAFPSHPAVNADLTSQVVNVNTFLLRLTITGYSEVRITPALNSANDLALPLMLGTNQGGIEVSVYESRRPVPNGIVFDIKNIPNFDSLKQIDINTVQINGISIPVSLVTAGTLMVNDAIGLPAPSINANSDGLREKFGLIAAAINNPVPAVAGFNWNALVWGSRLAILPSDSDENAINTITTSTTDIDAHFIKNVRFYSLGTSGIGGFQSLGLDGADGDAPLNSDYTDAYNSIDKNVDLFNLMVLPKDNASNATAVQNFYGQASVFCQQRRAILLMDPPDSWDKVQKATDPFNGVNSLRLGLVKDFSAHYYPNVTITDNNGASVQVGPSGAIAGLMARIDANRGVWKAPAGTEADLRGVVGLQYRFNDRENGQLNPVAINTLRIFPEGIICWGARTMDGDDNFASQWKYVPVRRTALFIEESLYRGLKWVVFEPNDEPLWAQIRLNVGAFMHNLFRQGAFQGKTRQEAYFVKCDPETTPQNAIDLGIVNIWVGFAPLKPAEFVILSLQQMTGQIQV